MDHNSKHKSHQMGTKLQTLSSLFVSRTRIANQQFTITVFLMVIVLANYQIATQGPLRCITIVNYYFAILTQTSIENLFTTKIAYWDKNSKLNVGYSSTSSLFTVRYFTWSIQYGNQIENVDQIDNKQFAIRVPVNYSGPKKVPY